MKTRKHYQKFNKIFTQGILVVLLMATVFNFNFIVAPEQSAAQAATNLIKRSSFEESDWLSYWTVWNGATSTRAYELCRSYDVPFGYGSYSAAVEVSGTPGDSFSAFMFGDQARNKFFVAPGQQYYLSFYAKADRNLDIVFFLQDAVNFNPISPVMGQSVTTDWQRYNFYVTPSAGTEAVIAFALGGLPDGSTIYLDGINLSLNTSQLTTAELSGYIGETNKCLSLGDISQYTLGEIKIELPYYDHTTSQATLKRFSPETKTNTNACINLYPQTFSGVGTAYVNDIAVGQFNYNIKPKVDLIIPSVPRADEDITIEGSGFSPIDDNTHLVVKAINSSGQMVDSYLKPHTIDSALTRAVVTLPLGVAKGSLFVQTSYLDKDSNVRINKSNTKAYSVQPVIFSLEWSQRGFEQVGDSVQITGKAITNAPVVIFYSESDEVIAKTRAKTVTVSDQEIIEVSTPKNLNQLKLTVQANGAESDKATALAYTAKPRLTKITSSKYRYIDGSSDKVQAAKTGDIITLSGQSFYSSNAATYVEFQGISERFKVAAAEGDVNTTGASLKVAVPQAAQTGYIAVEVNGALSNYLPLEIIPTIVSIAPNPIVPGQNITITAYGVGSNPNIATVYFTLAKSEETSRQPSALSVAQDGTATLTVNAPLAISHDSSSVKLQYNRWRSDETVALMVPPYITEAGIEPDSNILVIKGYGFSITPSENIITYKYADVGHTVITPKVKMLGVYPTEEGQEIRVQILDDYHYGYVEVTVDGQTSNEFNFGPVQIRRVARRIEYIANGYNRDMGVLYISGYNFGPDGGVKVGSVWADIHYRSEFFIIAVVEVANVYDNPVIVAKQ